MKNKAFLSYKVKVDNIDIKDEEFTNFNFSQQKDFLLSILDYNHLYVNLSEIEDENYLVTKLGKKINYEFYRSKE